MFLKDNSKVIDFAEEENGFLFKIRDLSEAVKEGEEESVLADAEDEESEEECDQVKESKPPGWLTIPKRKLGASKKNNQQRKGKRSGRIPLKKPKLRNSTLRTKQNSSVPNKSCRLT